MKKFIRVIVKVLLAGSLVVSVSPTINVSQVYAASYDNSFVQAVESRYNQLEAKYSDLYASDKKKATAAYDAFYEQIHNEQRILNDLVEKDLDELAKLLDRDYTELSDKYGGSGYRDALNAYQREINPNYTSGALWKYATAINENYLSSTHWHFANQINENYRSSLMWNYHNENNPNYSGSTMWDYSNEMNPNYTSSTMRKLRNESNINYSGGTMREYRVGRISRAEAEKRIDKVLTDGEKELQEIRDAAVASLDKTQKDTVLKLTALRDTTVEKLLLQRTSSLEEIMSLRKRHFGGELEVKPLIISFDKIKVIIDGELQKFEQPPVNKDGSVLVPMRAIFERLGAVISWNDTERSVTATKGSVTVYLQIGSTQPTVNGIAKPLEVPAQLVNSYTMVPVRFISESLGAEVSWDQASQTVYIKTQ
ncbi:copper amine oxidase N-terminal domain-containing protein [Paenibacillus naphthalenovorans]|uniref:copper amine oxidase N-terminal domain-containing protein n=1 Tax=Paenibacillus naphthalenovorans TaxID=162209 RepID=UPI003D2DAF18